MGYSARGLCELIRARIAFGRLEAKAIPLRNRQSLAGSATEPAIAEAALARISYVLPRLSDRLPWRSDCLVQAIAAQNWLSAMGAASEIQIGVENPKGGQFGAHAWLVHDGMVVTGGDIAKYEVILADSRMRGDSGDETVDRGAG
ncbi:lasso peptide biosynthesis B2 protein [Qipengyuania sp. ASV99]|uniref:lasso peptide biosynthesis B2 protein n=1 Tax=Qipengyuania sp. ASV99 TaxID=3399681 RepID=UPI003A4C55BB